MKAGPRLCSKPGGVGDTGCQAGRRPCTCCGLAVRLALDTGRGRPPRPSPRCAPPPPCIPNPSAAMAGSMPSPTATMLAISRP
jgi:hypothetical protein